MKIDWQALRFPFNNPGWSSKMLIGTALAFAAVFFWPLLWWLGLPVGGYGVRVMRATARGEAPSLPEWNNWAELFMDGLRVWVVSIVYGLPVIILSACAYASWIGYVVIFVRQSQYGADFEALLPAFGLYGLGFCMFGLTYLVGLPFTYLGLVGASRMAGAGGGGLGRAFEFAKVVRLARTGAPHFLLAVIVVLGIVYLLSLSSVALIYTLILAFLYPFLYAAALVYLPVIGGALLGQAYYQSTNTQGSKSSSSSVPATAPLKERTQIVVAEEPAKAKPARRASKKSGGAKRSS